MRGVTEPLDVVEHAASECIYGILRHLDTLPADELRSTGVMVRMVVEPWSPAFPESDDCGVDDCTTCR